MRSCEGCGAVFDLSGEAGFRNYKNHTCYQLDVYGREYILDMLLDLALLTERKAVAECYL